MSHRLSLDHLVYGVPDLADSIIEFEQKLGRAPRLGGKHEGLGTHNAILPLSGERYVELIAIDPEAPTPEHARPFGLDTLDGSRLITWAVRSRSIEADVERARATGFDPGPIIAMSRRSPKGDLLEWKLTLQTTRFGNGLIPFVIDWGNTPHPAAMATSDDDLVLDQFLATHPDPPPIIEAFAALGVDMELENGPESSLSAKLTGPAGDIVLR